MDREQAGNGIVTIAGNGSVEAIAERLQGLLESKGIKLFAAIDHSAEAGKAGLRMPPTKLLIFGSPKAGTPVMIATPDAAIDLPLKILVREDAAGRVWVSYNSPEYLRARHGFPEELTGNLAGVAALAASAAE